MKNLKTTLFEETFYHRKRYCALKRELGMYDRQTSVEWGKFVVLFDIIEESGLENEYEEWVEKQ